MDSQNEPTEVKGPMFSATNSPNKKSRVLWVLLAMVASAGVLVGAYAAYDSYANAPDRVLRRMVKGMEAVTSVAFDGTMTIEQNISMPAFSLFGGEQPPDTTEKTSQKGKMLMTFSGATELTSENKNAKMYAQFSVTSNLLPIGFGGEAKKIGAITYINITNVPDLGIFDLSAIRNQWIKIDAAEVRKHLGILGLEKQLAEVNKDSVLTPEEEQKVKEAFVDAGVVKVIAVKANEEISGTLTRHYELRVQKQGLINFVESLKKILPPSKTAPLERVTFEEDLKRIFFEKIPVEVWIGTKDNLLRRFALTIPTNAVSSSLSTESESEGSFTMVFNLSNFNQPVVVEAPANSKNIEDILSGLFGGLLGGLDKAPTDTPGSLYPSTKYPSTKSLER